MAPGYTTQVTLEYSIFIKRALVESLQAAFKAYSDPTISNARVAVDFDTRRWALPGVVITFQETELHNIGVGHVEWLDSPQDPDPSNPSLFVKYHHMMYKGDIVFDIWGQSSVDRDIVRDALVEVIGMRGVTVEGMDFFERFYNEMSSQPYGDWHFPVLSTDVFKPGGESNEIAPWQPEDILVYKVSYSIPIFGEFYSVTPELPASTGLLQEVDVYPWIPDIDPTPEEYPDIEGNNRWYRFTGWTHEEEVI